MTDNKTQNEKPIYCLMKYHLFQYKMLHLEFEAFQFCLSLLLSVSISLSLPFPSSSFIMEISCSKTGNSIQVSLTSGPPASKLENQCSVTSENRIHFGFLYYLPLGLGHLFADWLNYFNFGMIYVSFIAVLNLVFLKLTLDWNC